MRQTSKDLNVNILSYAACVHDCTDKVTLVLCKAFRNVLMILLFLMQCYADDEQWLTSEC